MRLLLFLLLLIPQISHAQDAAQLIADSVRVTADKQLIASGNVEVFYQGTRLSTAQIRYSQSGDRLTITGPIFIATADGTILTADRASLDPQLENGMLIGARIVLEQKLQLVANQIDRREGRYNQLYKAQATSCKVCGTSAPLWSIRAERVIHDTLEDQLYFENATLRIKGLPIAYLPRIRLPGPTLERSTGFLIPQQRSTNRLGLGLKLPYFITLGQDKDLTLTPYFAAETRTLEAVYRQAFRRGNLEIEGAISDDSLTDDANRTYLFANGDFITPGDVQLTFDIEATSDPAYLVDYGYASKDRLDSAISAVRVTPNSLGQASLTYYQTLRDDENNGALPPWVLDGSYEIRQQPRIGGILSFKVSGDAIYRYDTDQGRDVIRAGIAADWTRDWISTAGIISTVQTGITTDLYQISDDSDFNDNGARTIPAAGVTFRWPLGKRTQNGTQHLIEPTIALAWSDSIGFTPPNEDSTTSELDQANLFALNRFGGNDAVETGARAAAGLTWTRQTTSGLNSTLTFGRVVRDENNTAFTPSSGLSGTASDWLIAGQISHDTGLQLDLRTLLDNDAEVQRAAALLGWDQQNFNLNAAYIWQQADPTEARPDTISEWTFDARYRINDIWRISADGRYNVADDRPVRGGIGLQWKNECVTINLSASRLYSSSSTIRPTTSFGLSGSLTGFSAGRSAAGPAARCK